MRSMWKGAISFGLVTIPVKLYTATEAKDVRFNLLHEACRSPVQYRKWCANCDREIASEEIVKGYEYDRGRYVIIGENDLETMPTAAGRTVDIVDFVRLDQIDPIYFEKTYYLEPGEGGAKAYALLRRAMEQTGRIAIARVVIRSKESLAALRVYQNGVLAMETMHFPDEIRSTAGLTGIVEPELRPSEMEMAVNLVGSLSGDFHPEKFQNEYRQELLTMIHAKIAGEEVVAVSPAPERGQVVDLMEALRASIRLAEEAREQEGGTAKPSPAPPVPAPLTPGVPIQRLSPNPPPLPGLPIPGVPTAGAHPPRAPYLPGLPYPNSTGVGATRTPGGPNDEPTL
jgi:DNA end-binding protein Ku